MGRRRPLHRARADRRAETVVELDVDRARGRDDGHPHPRRSRREDARHAGALQLGPASPPEALAPLPTRSPMARHCGCGARFVTGGGMGAWWSIPWPWKLHQGIYDATAWWVAGLVLSRFADSQAGSGAGGVVTAAPVLQSTLGR